MKKRLSAIVMALVMAMSLLPVSALADVQEDTLKPADKYYTYAGTETTANEADITLSKTAERAVDEAGNVLPGVYNVTLTATAKEKVTPVPTEVVFVLDGSGSMNFCTDSEGYISHQHNDDWFDPRNCHYDSKTETCDVLKKYAHVHTWDKNNVAYCSLVKNGSRTSRWVYATQAIADMAGNLGTENISCEYVLYQDGVGGRVGGLIFGGYMFIPRTLVSEFGLQSVAQPSLPDRLCCQLRM